MLLITGANGLLGSHVVRRFLQESAPPAIRVLIRPDADRRLLADVAHQIEWMEGDLLDVLSLERALQGVTHVVHAGAIVSFIPKDRPLMHRINVEGTANLVNACLETDVQKLLFVSSVAALGRSDKKFTASTQIINETAKWEESSLNSNYAKSKYLAELEVWRGSTEGLPMVMVNPSIVLGAGDWHRSSTQLFRYAYDEHAFFPKGKLNYVDVLDVAEAIFRLLYSGFQNERFILNAGAVSYQEFFEKTARAFGKTPPAWSVPKAAAQLLWPLEAARSWLTGKPPLLTRETAQSASHSYFYPSDKIKQAIGLQFRPLDETINRITGELVKGE